MFVIERLIAWSPAFMVNRDFVSLEKAKNMSS